MLLKRIGELSVGMTDLLAYLKGMKIDPNKFFTMNIELQYGVICKFILLKYNIGITITPYTWFARYYTAIDNELIVCKPLGVIEKNTGEMYETIIEEIFRYIQDNPF